MSCYLVYAMTPLLEVTLVPTGYVVAGHALSSVQLTDSSISDTTFSHDKFLTYQQQDSSPPLTSGISSVEKPRNSSRGIGGSRCRRRRMRTRHTRSRENRRDFGRDCPRRARQRQRLCNTNPEGRNTEVAPFEKRNTECDDVNEGTVSSSLDGKEKETLIKDGGSKLASFSLAPLLYCDLCRVKLNAAGQAKQHFEGKIHTRKLKLAQMCRTSETYPTATDISDKTISSADDGVTSGCQGNPASPTVISNPSVYCNICGISFNSDKQSRQHYRGKLHAKKQRLANHLSRCTARKFARAIIEESGQAQRRDSKENCSPRGKFDS